MPFRSPPIRGTHARPIPLAINSVLIKVVTPVHPDVDATPPVGLPFRMAAATPAMVPAISDADIGQALLYRAAAAFSTAATGTEFNDRATIQAAKAHKHTSFAAKLFERSGLADRLAGALGLAETKVLSALSDTPQAIGFITRVGAFAMPELSGGMQHPSTTQERQQITVGTTSVTSRAASAAFALWALRHGIEYVEREIATCAPETSNQDVVIRALAASINKVIPAVTTAIRDGLSYARELNLRPAGEAPPNKRRRTGDSHL